MSDTPATNENTVINLHETFVQLPEVIFDPYTVTQKINENNEVELVESRDKPGNMRIRGIFQYENRKNGNGRVYPTGLWEKHLNESSNLAKMVKDRRCVGQIEHPASGAGDLKESAILVTKLWLGKPEADASRAVLGEAEVLDTPNGRIVRDLIRNNVRIGISSRGKGAVNQQGVVDEKTFTPLTWDIVGSPSTPGAYPEVVDVRESITGHAGPSSVKCFLNEGALEWRNPSGACIAKTTGVRSMSHKERLNRVEANVAALVATVVNESNAASLDEALKTNQRELSEIAEADASLRSEVGTILAQVEEARSVIADAKKGKKSKEETPEPETDESDETSQDARTLLKKASDALGEQQTRITELEAALQSSETAAEELAETITALETERDDLLETIGVQTTLVRRITSSKSEVALSVNEAIEQAIEANPGLERLRGVMERCTSPDEIKVIVESIPAPNKAPRSLDGRSDLPRPTTVRNSKDGQLSESSTPNNEPATSGSKPKALTILEAMSEKRRAARPLNEANAKK